MVTRTAVAAKRVAAKKAAASRSGAGAGGAANGLRTYSLHSRDEGVGAIMSRLNATRSANPSFAFAGPAGLAKIDPETAARGYLEHALESDATPGFVAPTADAVPSEFKSLGIEAVPLTGTTIVKFRQNFNKIPVYGSLVTVELDESNNLVGINSSLGTPSDVNAVAKISAAAAVRAVKEYPGHAKNLDRIVPRLNYWFDGAKSRWRLVFILEDVPVIPKGSARSPVLMDYIVDAASAKVVAELPRTPTVAVQETAVDGLKKPRRIELDQTGKTRLLKDATLNVQTFDFKFGDPVQQASALPGKPIKNPPAFAPAAVSAHANAEAVSTFLRSVLKRNNIDNKGGLMKSSINCVDAGDSPDGKEWVNAFWNGEQMVYGQRHDGKGFLSMSVALDVVGHEMFHGVTDMTSRLEYALQPGALNESYSDIFGIIIANQPDPDPRGWKWEVGAGLQADGSPFRDMSDPARFGQPASMKDFKVLPNSPRGDYGGVHTNSGIHNKAAYNVLTAVAKGALVFTPAESAAIFYLALTQRLTRTSQFADSRVAVIDSARSLFRTLPTAALAVKISALEAAFTAVGIK
jgi:Zn-dependent metalloprotease